MLFMINKTQPGLVDRVALLAGDEDKEILLVGDGVFFATDFMVKKFQGIGVGKVYVSTPCLATRGVKLSGQCRVVGYDQMVPLIMEEHEKTISL